MNVFQGRTIVLGVGGGIAAYRVCELARLFMKRGADVRVVMTENAQRFVTAGTFQALTGNPVLTDLFDLHQKAIFGHLETGKRADLFIVAPATANLIARVRFGMGDDALTTSILSSACPVLIAPAMNSAMSVCVASAFSVVWHSMADRTAASVTPKCSAAITADSR